MGTVQEHGQGGGYFSELFGAATYRHLLYFVVATLLSVVTALALTAALLGAALSPLLLGVPLLVLGGWALGRLANLDRALGSALLDVNLSRAAPLRPPGWWPWLRARLTEANTYKVLLYSVLKLPFTVLSSAWLGLTLLGGLGLMALPAALHFFPELNLPVALGNQGYVLGRASTLLLACCGFFVVMLGVSSLNLLARAWMIVSYGLLTEYGEHASAVREVAALRAGAATVAFAGSLEETLSELLRISLSATSAQSVRITVGRVTAELGAWPAGQMNSGPGSGQVGEPPLSGRDTLSRVGSQQVLSLAVAARGEVLGTLHALYDAPPGNREIQFWAAVTDQAASAADTARLIDQAQLQGSEQERARLARELHDSVAQALYGVSLAARSARALIDKNPVRAAESLDFALNLADGASAEMRALLFALRPDALEEGGLVPALSRLAEMLRLRYQLAVQFDAPAEPPLGSEIKGTLYRVAQEATHNAVKHARARQLSLSLLPSSAGWTLRIRDDGLGFDPAHTRPGSLGLKSMRERAALIGGQLDLESAPGAGTTLTLSVKARPAPAESSAQP
ncbi:sensor histidine kinase [Deinococcus rubellus]|uniref:Sensor histidine kinase n=1 Tax=Deinococcus rubellus TaxID=1889240 RepID=A0ABY5YHF3_9DEIO|nr:sensor histidine kinase [Deinococcus rubellus]UWX63233.1 sensor histidine kinase [Deinococcus rubellus]